MVLVIFHRPQSTYTHFCLERLAMYLTRETHGMSAHFKHLLNLMRTGPKGLCNRENSYLLNFIYVVFKDTGTSHVKALLLCVLRIKKNII